jgi:hypothetical protein
MIVRGVMGIRPMEVSLLSCGSSSLDDWCSTFGVAYWFHPEGPNGK